ncbi:hypothetical protein [Eisenibacter elegans]|jgi:hypothetical protein|uniref:hypothetical protein n=1 Tax=Eisenibacter elegans TaxID=997 RepID=UPI000402E491|nr:hypothetical protein [Eisenibacter elegans]
MKALLFSGLLLLAALSANAQTQQPVSDSLSLSPKRDSLATSPSKDSVRYSSGSILLRQQSTTHTLTMPEYKEHNSQYIYGNDGRVTGGSTNFKVGKKKKN